MILFTYANGKRIFLFGCFVWVISCSSAKDSADERAVRAINQRYTEAWLHNDENGVLSLFEENAAITPSGMSTIKGIEAIRNFWFPKDSSVTAIHVFNNQIVAITVDSTVASTFKKTYLSWSYAKGDVRIAKDQWGLAMSVYRKQPNGEWKIWRQLWTDVRTVDR
ncbi:nuclear transport factor 2 family protein [bacterium]|nr:nuclear transport factor 2 family protein [bacterium]